MKIKKCLCFLALVIIVLVIAKCDFDTGLGLMKSRLSGRIVFLNPVLKADYVDAVRVVAVVNFPPETLGDVIFSNSVDISADTVYYSIPAPLASYQAVGAVWKRKGREWDYTNILGLYGVDWDIITNPLNWDKLSDVKIETVTLDEQNPIAEDVDIQADWGRTQLDGTIKGKVDFVGTRPEKIEYMGIFAFSQVPKLGSEIELVISFLALRGFDISVPKDKDEYKYSLAVSSGEIRWLGIAFMSIATSIDDVKILGFYHSPDNPSKPGSITVERNGVIEGINFNCDFDTLPDGLPPGG